MLIIDDINKNINRLLKAMKKRSRRKSPYREEYPRLKGIPGKI